MAELKDMLKKVLTSKGVKKFFFAYGMGKRKDGKRDGEWPCSARNRRRADIEKE